jgi:hypothetical protein
MKASSDLTGNTGTHNVSTATNNLLMLKSDISAVYYEKHMNTMYGKEYFNVQHWALNS